MVIPSSPRSSSAGSPRHSASAHTALELSAEQRIEVAWTSPGTDAVPLRRVDQVLYELIEAAKSEILLVTYAAYKAARALDALQAATERGVRVGLVIELAQESGGKISFDGSHTIHARVPQANIFYWPPERRTRSEAGAHRAMHVKCLIADRRLALVIQRKPDRLRTRSKHGTRVGGVIPGRLAAHFDQLVLRGELVSAPAFRT